MIAFNPTKIRNVIVPGNFYRTAGSVHGWPYDWGSDKPEFMQIFTWDNFAAEMRARGMSKDIINQIWANYGHDTDFWGINAEDSESLEFTTYDRYGRNPRYRESSLTLITI